MTTTHPSITLTLSTSEARAICAVLGALNGDVFPEDAPPEGDTHRVFTALADYLDERGIDADSPTIPVHPCYTREG